MDPLLVVFGLTLALALGGYLAVTARQRRHAALSARPFPERWERILRRNVKHYRAMPDDLREQLRANVQIFLAEKSFEGCLGLQVTEEMKVTVAGYASLLILNRKTSRYGQLRTVLMYPSAYLDREARESRTGESWEDTVVLAWDEVTLTPLVVHEFAHQLDQEDGSSDGVPRLRDDSMYEKWAEVMGPEYERLREGQSSLLDEYGALNPAEFFAVSTETFFEHPRQLKSLHPALYEQLALYYRLDPAGWSESLTNP